MPAPVELVNDLSHLHLDLISELKKDLGDEKKYATHTIITDRGQANCLYKINTTKNSFYTVSSEKIGPKCLHYVLTEEGLSYVKQLVVIASL